MRCLLLKKNARYGSGKGMGEGGVGEEGLSKNTSRIPNTFRIPGGGGGYLLRWLRWGFKNHFMTIGSFVDVGFKNPFVKIEVSEKT